jgi:hypothetical protein
MPRKKTVTENEKSLRQAVGEPREIKTQKEIITAPSFFDVDYNETDRELSPGQLKEWTAIYASFRSKTPLTGTVSGVDAYQLSVTNPSTKAVERKQILCLVIMDFRVKVIIPETEIWYDSEETYPEYVIKRMVGAKVNYVVTNVDRPGECAIASRRMALGYVRNHFFKDSRRTEPGQIQDCNVLVVGPKRIIAECNGFDLHLRSRDLSYTAIADLRTEYKPGQELKAKLLKFDSKAGTIEASVKEVNPNPFYGADRRHPVNSTRQAVISGTYAGGVFCRMPDDTTVLCLYSPRYFSEEFYIGDSVLMVITQYDYDRKLIYGRILSKQ